MLQIYKKYRFKHFFLIVFLNILLKTNVTDKIMFSEGKLYKSTNMRTIVVGITHIYKL